MTTTRRLDRQEMERRVVLLRELVEDAECRLRQYGPGGLEMHGLLTATSYYARAAYRVAEKQLEAYREEWERVK